MIPTLRRHGITPEVQIVYYDGIEAPWQNYILQLQSAGIDHVIFSGAEAHVYGPAFAMRAAENQRYYPKWGIATDNSPAGVGQLAPRDQVRNTQGMGWMPVRDVSDVSDQSPHTALCNKIDRDAGNPPNANAVYCENLLFLKFVLDRAAEVSPRGMSEALDRVAGHGPVTGEGWPSAG